MWAYNLYGINDLRKEEISKPVLTEGWVLVEVKAAGICGSDIPRIFETGTYSFPLIPGHEFSGVVVEVADKGNRDLIGKRVGIFPLIPCKECHCCRNQSYETCSNYSYLGSRIDGGFAEFVLVPEWNLIEIPDAISFEEAALLEPISVALHALRSIQYNRIATAMIYGVGPIGLIIAQWLRIFGVEKIVLVANKEEQITIANNLGFINCLNSKAINVQQWINNNAEYQDIDLVVEGVGTADSLHTCIDCVAANGTLVTLANPKGDILIEKSVYWKILRKQITVKGTWNSSFKTIENDDWDKAVKALENKDINVIPMITHRISNDEVLNSLKSMKDKKEFYCKVVIIC